ncbi:PadR family transcriptional regulator, partial [Streptomyces corynorhini]
MRSHGHEHGQGAGHHGPGQYGRGGFEGRRGAFGPFGPPFGGPFGGGGR